MTTTSLIMLFMLYACTLHIYILEPYKQYLCPSEASIRCKPSLSNDGKACMHEHVVTKTNNHYYVHVVDEVLRS